MLNFPLLQISGNAQKPTRGRCGDLQSAIHSAGTIENIFGEPVKSPPPVMLQESFYRWEK